MIARVKHNRILILMITSQFLLTLFVIQWLYSQYSSEREDMVKELNGFWIDSHNEVLDTLVLKRYVNPLLNGQGIKVKNKSGELTGVFVADTSLYITSGDNNRQEASTGKGLITVKINHSADSPVRKVDTITKRGISEDFIMRSVKMIVSRAEDSMNSNNQNVSIFAIRPDTVMFKKHFSGRISGAGMKLHISWENKEDSTLAKEHRRLIHINPLTSFPFPEASVGRYNSYLAGRIMPQIIFGLLLIIITAIAFTLSYRSIRQQAIVNNLRNEFINNITHELKTPVATLSVALESLRKFNLQAEPLVLDEYLMLASKETKRLEELINRVLDHSVLEENSNLLNIKIVDINSLVLDTAGIIRHSLPAGGSVEVVPYKENIAIPGDPLFIKGVLLNLLDNSVRYCDKVPAITIVTRIEKGFAVIEVNDNGPGIPEEYQSRIFEKFFRLPNENVHDVKGYGLGLSFAALVMRLHRGSIGVRNLKPGASFTLKLPRE